jgi:O-antigen/teichoic acid export membrane protein
MPSFVRPGSIARNMAVVGGATALGQGLVMLAAPLLARLYDPQSFGLLSVFTALLFVLLSVASLRYDLALPIAREPAEAVHGLAVSVLLGVVASAVVALLVLAFGTPLATAMGAAGLAPYLWLLPAALLVASAAQAVASWALYQRSFGALARMRLIQGVSQVGGQAALGLLHVGPFGLLAGDVAGRVAGLEQILRPLRTAVRATPPTRSGMRQFAAHHWPFARVMTVASLLNALALQVPFLLIPVLFDIDSSGQYFLAYRVLVLPASLVAAAASQVFFGEAAFRRNEPERLHDLARDAAVSLFVFSIPTYAIIAVAGPSLITTVFGGQWGAAGLYAQISAPWLILWSVASPISSLLLVGRREIESLAFTAADLVLKVAALLVGAALHSAAVGIVVLSVVSVLGNVAALWRILRVARVSLRELGRPTARITGITALPLAVVAVVVVVAPPAVLPACAVAWLVAAGLAARSSPELRALLADAR